MLERGKFGELEPGDIIYMNVPYWSGAHTNDGVLIAPVFFKDAIGSDMNNSRMDFSSTGNTFEIGSDTALITGGVRS